MEVWVFIINVTKLVGPTLLVHDVEFFIHPVVVYVFLITPLMYGLLCFLFARIITVIYGKMHFVFDFTDSVTIVMFILRVILLVFIRRFGVDIVHFLLYC